jgi:CheY-like chemotaxis protein
VALTANVMSHQVDAYAEAGMDAFVAKPISVADLYDAIARFAVPSAAPETRREA